MNEIPRFSALREPLNPLIHPLDAILADIAINCQLPPSLFSKAVDRYEAVRAHIERPGSPLEGKVACFYPQGSMGIDATISIRGTDDEYDLDIVAELEIPDAVTPEQALDILEKALEDYPVTKVIRQTRCVTLKYADRMHLDITPSRRLRTLKERESVIFHSKKGSSRNEQLLVPANSFAFVNWYRMRTPLERRFAYEFNRRLYDHAGIEFRADAEVHDVPKQTPLIVKSVTTVAHQLIKRFRNILYITATGRIPPSVMLACHAGHAASPGMTLSDMVVRQARWTTRAINDAERDNSLIDVRNPEWSEDKFTDRWPENRKQQQEFARGLLIWQMVSKRSNEATSSSRTCRAGCEVDLAKPSCRVRSRPSIAERVKRSNRAHKDTLAAEDSMFQLLQQSSARRFIISRCRSFSHQHG